MRGTLLVVCLLALRGVGCRSERRPDPKAEHASPPWRGPFENYTPPAPPEGPRTVVTAPEQRLTFFTSTPEQLYIAAAPRAVWGMVMDASFGAERGTIVALQNGDARFYTVEGVPAGSGGAYPLVREAARTFCAKSEKRVARAKATTDFSYPDAGRVRFYFLTPSGVRFVEADEKELQGGKHRLSELYVAGQHVRDELREVYRQMTMIQ